MRFFLALAALFVAAPVAAQHERAAIEAQFKAASEICAQRFFVNACLDEAKSQRNASLKPLQEREALAEAQERRARADAQRERVAEREREFAATEARNRTAELLAASPKPLPLASPAAPGIKPRAVSAPDALSVEAAQQAKQAQARDAAQRRQAQKADYQRDQLARQKAAEQRQTANDEKLAGKKPPAALPIPSAAEIEAASSAPPPLKR